MHVQSVVTGFHHQCQTAMLGAQSVLMLDLLACWLDTDASLCSIQLHCNLVGMNLL